MKEFIFRQYKKQMIIMIDKSTMVDEGQINKMHKKVKIHIIYKIIYTHPRQMSRQITRRQHDAFYFFSLCVNASKQNVFVYVFKFY